MSKQEIKKEEKPEELIRAKKLIDEGKHDEALELMKKFEEKEEHPLQDIVFCHLLKCNLLFQQGKYEDVIKLAGQTYKKSLGLEKSILSVDALMFMARGLIESFNVKPAIKIITQAEELLATLTEELVLNKNRREAHIGFLKGEISNPFYTPKGDMDLALKYYKHSLALGESLGDKIIVCNNLLSIAWGLGTQKGEIDNALEYVERTLAFAKEANYKLFISYGLLQKASFYHIKGEVTRSIPLYEQSLAIAKEFNHKQLISSNLNNMADAYRMNGELDRALECSEQSLAQLSKSGELKRIANNHDFLIQILIEKGDLEQAQQYFNHLEQLNNQLKDKRINIMYLFDKALILKTNPRASNQRKAEEILKHILEDEDFEYEIYIKATLNLCEVLLIKFSNNNNLKILDEIQKYINQIIIIAKNSHSYWLLAETNILQAKLELLTLDLNKAKESLERAQQIAEEYGLNQLTERISIEQDKLFSYTNKWLSSKNSTATIVELSNLAPLKEQIQYMLKKREILKRFNI